MRVGRISAEWAPELGRFEIRPGGGLLGWAGGSSRDRRLFADLLRWSLGLPVGSSPAYRGDPLRGKEGNGDEGWLPLPWSSRGPRPAMELDVMLGGRELSHVYHPGRGSGSIDGGSLFAAVGLPALDLAVAWAGGAASDPDELFRRGCRVLAGKRGGRTLAAALVRLGGDPGMVLSAEGGLDGAGASELAEIEKRLEFLEDAPARLRALEEKLRSLRADAAEAAGDLEVATMDWLRERQDAETHLQTYRDQARELKARMEEMEAAGPEGECPFCGRPLGEHAEDVAEELNDEWERLVQDGSWWRRRRDQLELKPDSLQELEGRVVRLQAEVEECAETLERKRFDLREWDELRNRRDLLRGMLGMPRPDTTEKEEEGDGSARRRTTVLASAVDRARRELERESGVRLARRAGNILNRISGGRILGLIQDDERGVALVEDGRLLPGPGLEDRAATTLSLHLAIALELVEGGTPMESILVEESFRSMELEARLRAVDVLRDLRSRIPQIILMAGAEVVDSVPERFDEIIEMRRGRDRGGLRLLEGGVGKIRITGMG